MSSSYKKDQAPFCACGCGERVKRSQAYKGWNKFIHGHYTRLHQPMNNPESCKKISFALTGRKLSKETRKKLSIINTGKRHSKKTKRKMSESHKGKTFSKESLIKRSISRFKCRADGYCDVWSDKEFKEDCRKSHCEICGRKEKWEKRPDGRIYCGLLLHHIDCDPKNCHPDNLQTLCVNCHFILHKKIKKTTKNRASVPGLAAYH